MKRLSFFFVFLLVGVWSFAQREPKELTFSNTVIMKGVSKDELFKRALRWGDDMERIDGLGTSRHEYFKEKSVNHHCIVKDCPNFGLSKLLMGTGTDINFFIKINCHNQSYTATVSHINVSWNPHFGILYGENGALYDGYYNKKELKTGNKIVDYLSDYSDVIFNEIKDYMTKD